MCRYGTDGEREVRVTGERSRHPAHDPTSGGFMEMPKRVDMPLLTAWQFIKYGTGPTRRTRAGASGHPSPPDFTLFAFHPIVPDRIEPLNASLPAMCM